MNQKKEINHLFDESDLALTQLSSTFAQCSIWLAEGMDKQIATFDLTVRDMPKNRNYLVAGGLEEFVRYIQNLKYTDKQIQLLLNGKVITEEFAKYLKNFRFSGDIDAMPEGTIFFPGEPIIRVTAPIIEAALIEIVLFNISVSNIIFMSKAARIRSVCKDKVISLGMQRGHSFESGMKGLRSGYICGLASNGWPSFVSKYGLNQDRYYVISGQHFYIKSFADELEAFRKFAKHFPDNTAFMIDTYDIKKGLDNAVIVGKELKKTGGKLTFVTIDSGDLNELSKMARTRLDENGLYDTKILVATSMNEYKINKLLSSGAPIDSFIVATEYVTMLDAPSLEVVYKMAEIREGSSVRNTAKLAPGKTSYPGRKQVFREYKNGVMVHDFVGLETENYGTPMLEKIMRNGILKIVLPSMDEMKEYFNKQLQTIPKHLLDVEKDHKYEVVISEKILKIFEDLKKEHLHK